MNSTINSRSLRAQRFLGVGLLLGFLAFTACAVFWWAPVAQVLRSRLATGLLSFWCGCFGFYVNPRFRVGFARGVREFRNATKQLFDDHNDDDDDPHSI
jgi:hypothetical protein